MTINAGSGVIDWVPQEGLLGDFNVTLRADKDANSVTQDYVLTVVALGDVNASGEINAGDYLLVQRHVLGIALLNEQQIKRADLYPPSSGDGVVNTSDLILMQKKMWFTSAPVTTAVELESYQYTAQVNNTGGTFSLDAAPTGMTIDASTGSIDWIPAEGQSGDFDVTVRVDKDAETASQDYVLNVVVKGDINADGIVNAVDMLLVQQHLLGFITLDAQQIARGDMYPAGGDGQLTISDLLLITRKALGF